MNNGDDGNIRLGGVEQTSPDDCAQGSPKDDQNNEFWRKKFVETFGCEIDNSIDYKRLYKRISKMKNEEIIEYSLYKGYLPLIERFLSDTKWELADAFLIACEYGHLDIAKYLIMRASDPLRLIEDQNYGAFRIAAQNGHLPILKYLTSGNDVGLKTNYNLAEAQIKAKGYYALRWAKQNRHIHVVEYLVSLLNYSDRLQ